MYLVGSEAEMADFYNAPQGAHVDYSSNDDQALRSGANRLQGMTNVAGALVSLALIAGIGVWGYKLLVRDVSGIPVVRAVEGDMRVRSDDPGGLLAQHQGLSVNAVAAEGTAAQPADQLRLAPQAVDLEDEDQVAQTTMVAPTPQEAPMAPSATNSVVTVIEDVAAALDSGNVEDLVAQLTQGVQPLTDLAASPEEVVATVVASVQEAVATTVSAGIDAPGVRQSLRPRKRPIQQVVVTNASLTSTESASQASNGLDATDIPAGTRLAQLGAFDSETVAREQWDQLSNRFNVYLGDKQRVIQKASSGGRVFYRLRAMGFEDIADARRFCSALVAENADCIPVVTR